MADERLKYADLFVEWLCDLGYSHCFFVAGGNNMHLLDGVRSRMTCVPFVHEMSAGIAAEYFNELSLDGQRAFALVTAGPGLTHLVSALAGAYLESRELLVVGGQVKSSDLAQGMVRQRGIQEVDGTAIAAPVCKAVSRLERPLARPEVERLVRQSSEGRPGPVFLEMCLDVQGAPVDPEVLGHAGPATSQHVSPAPSSGTVEPLVDLLREAQRPVLLLGGGLTRTTVSNHLSGLRAMGIPLMTTWNAADRVAADDPLYFGRPNTWGQRAANVLLQQSDAIVALGSRLSMQQTGFNWQEFAPLARLGQVDIDERELDKGHPRVDVALHGDANAVLAELVRHDYGDHSAWIEFCRDVWSMLPLDERESNQTAPGYLSPYTFVDRLAAMCDDDDIVVPSSSGGAFTVFYQAFSQKSRQLLISNKALAAMGYGLAGAIGAALRHPARRVVHMEGDGGFSQNLQELATVAANGLNVKTFVLSNEGYASIRMTQRNYFDGQYLGCDTATGLGFPQWTQLFAAYGIPCAELPLEFESSEDFMSMFAAPGPAAFVVPIDPEQTYFPKISSRVTASGSMESNPLHLLSPDLPPEIASHVLRYVHEESPMEAHTT